MDESTPETTAGPALNAIEARILGCLIEKAAITPEVYPLTLNALVAACNQKTSREPVLQLEPGAVAHALRDLETRELARVAPSSQRVSRYEHRFDTGFNVTTRQRAVLGLLLLRGPQTLNELLTRSERLAEFPSIEDVRDTLDRLAQREPPLAVNLGRASGQREDRYMHLLCGPVDADAYAASAAADTSGSVRGGLAERVAQLEGEIEDLRVEVDTLRARLEAAGI